MRCYLVTGVTKNLKVDLNVGTVNVLSTQYGFLILTYENINFCIL